MWNQNRLTEMLGITEPIIQAPMAGGTTTSELVASASNFGGLGMIGAGYLDDTQLREQVRKTKQQTDERFGVNLFVVDPLDVSEQKVSESMEDLKPFRKALEVSEEVPNFPMSWGLENKIHIILEEDVPVCSFTFGIPSQELISLLKQNNRIVIGTATTVKEAIAVENAGMDAVVVQGSEAGGHRATFLHSEEEEGLVGTMALVPQVVDHVHIPVIASGGIMDARGCAAAYMLGAEATQLGTVFLTTYESGAREPHKKAIMIATEEETVITKAFSGKNARGIRNEFTEHMKDKTIAPYPFQNTLTKVIRKEAARQEKSQYMSLWAGQGNRLNKFVSANELLTELTQETKRMLGELRI